MNVLGKALAVLQAVADHPQGVGLPDLAARLGMPRQTVHRVLGQLRDSGLLLRDPVRERFSVGPRLIQLSLSALGSTTHGRRCGTLRELVDDLGETCNIGVLEGLEYIYVDRIESKWPLRIHLEVGYRAAVDCIAGGKVLLAYLEPELRARLLRSRKLVSRDSALYYLGGPAGEGPLRTCGTRLRHQQPGELRGHRRHRGADPGRQRAGGCRAHHARPTAARHHGKLRGDPAPPAPGRAAHCRRLGSRLTCGGRRPAISDKHCGFDWLGNSPARTYIAAVAVHPNGAAVISATSLRRETKR